MKKKLALLAMVLMPHIAFAQWPGSNSASASAARPNTKNYGTIEKGNTATGGEGCYFGEGEGCSDKAPPKPEPAPPKRNSPDPVSGSYPPPPQVTNVCQTPAFWCVMGQFGPPGMPCYCNLPMPMGYANGITVLRR